MRREIAGVGALESHQQPLVAARHPQVLAAGAFERHVAGDRRRLDAGNRAAAARSAADRTPPGDGRPDIATHGRSIDMVMTRSMRAPMSTCCSRSQALEQQHRAANQHHRDRDFRRDDGAARAIVLRRDEPRDALLSAAAAEPATSGSPAAVRRATDTEQRDRRGKREHAQFSVISAVNGNRAARSGTATLDQRRPPGRRRPRRRARRAPGSRPAAAPQCGRGVAPSATRTAISFARAALRASSRLVMFAQAISSTSTTAPSAT